MKHAIGKYEINPSKNTYIMLKLEVIGNLGASAEVKTGNGRTFISFRVAHSRKYRDGAGNSLEETIWVSCALTYTGHENLIQYLTTGTKVFIRGYMGINIYEDKNHERKAGINVNVTELELCGSKQETKEEDKPF